MIHMSANSEFPDPNSYYIYDYKKCNITGFSDYLACTNWSVVSIGDDSMDNFVEILKIGI